MDNQRLVHSGSYLTWCQCKKYCQRFIRDALCASVVVCVAMQLQADTLVKESRVLLHAKHPYNADLPAEFGNAIPFQWQYLPTSNPMPSAMGYTWRHSYHFRLLQNKNKLELIKPDGTKRVFTPIDANNFVADQYPNESIQQKQKYYHLATPEIRTVFFGSYPVAITKHNKPTINLRYKNGVLAQLFDENGNKLLLNHSENGALTSVTQTDGASITFEYDQYNRLAASRSSHLTNRFVYPTAPPVTLCTAVTPNAQPHTPLPQSVDQGCDVNNNPPPSSFQLNPLTNHSIKIDLRPQSCRSYFVDYNGIERGVKLESGMLMHSRYSNLIPTVRSYPVVDFIDGREAVAVHTKDLTSKTYNPTGNSDGLYQSIIRDAQKADDKFLGKLTREGFVSAKEKGVTTTITKSDIDTLRMEVMIQAGAASPWHLAQIERARLTLLSKWNIKLITVVIP